MTRSVVVYIRLNYGKEWCVMIYGTAILAGCMLVGSFIGELLGFLTGVGKDIGGVGFAMVLLLLVTNSKTVNSIMPKGYEKGIDFWKNMFLPIIVALSMQQNVIAALADGWVVALVAGAGVVVVAFLLIPVFNILFPEKKGKNNDSKEV